MKAEEAGWPFVESEETEKENWRAMNMEPKTRDGSGYGTDIGARTADDGAEQKSGTSSGADLATDPGPASPKKSWSRNPYVLMPLLLLMWGSFSATNKLLLASLDPYLVIFYMYGLALPVFLVVILYQGNLRELRAWRWKDYGLLTGCGTLAFLYDYFYLQALEVLPALEASMLNYLFPVFIVLFAIPLHRERFSVRKGLSILLGFGGTLLLITKGDWTNLAFTQLRGDLLAILAAVCWGLLSNLIKWNRRDAALSNLFLTAVAFLWSVASLWGNSAFAVPSLPNLGGLLWLALSNIVLGFFLYFRALKVASASLVASFTFFTPCVTLIFIMVLVGERLSWIDLLAFLLIFLSVPVQSGWFKRKRN